MTQITNVLFVPYGGDTLPARPINVRSFGSGKVRLELPFPCAAINKAAASPLRLNSESLSFGSPQDETPLNLIRGHLKGFCRTWDKLSLQFLDDYFEHIAEMLKVHQNAIATKLAPFLGLYIAEDWAFSAPKPMPRAHLHVSGDNGDDYWDVDDFVQVDFAFWLGDRMVAVLSQPGVLTPARAKERLSRLEEAGVAVVHFTAESLSTGRADLFNRIIGDFGALLERAGPVPTSPFRPQVLGDL
jgi:hypothetical protein